MGDHQVCLRWNNFHSSLAATLEYMWDEESLVDVTLFCEGQEIRAHKVILSACSPAFKAMLRNNACQHPIIILHNISLCDLEAILQFIYKGEVNIEQGRLGSLLRAAASLQIRGLAGIAEREKTVDSPPPPVATEEPPPAKKTRKSATKNAAQRRSSTPPPAAAANDVKKRATRGRRDETLVKEEPQSEDEATSPLPPPPLPADVDDMADDDEEEAPAAYESDDAVDETDPLDPLRDPPVPAPVRAGGGESPVTETLVNANKAFTCKNTQYPPYPCPFCCRAYSSWGFRRRHIKAMHTLSTQLPCKWCSAVLLSRDQWEGHVVSDHQLSKADAEQGLMVLEEAHMVLQTQPNANAPAHVDMVKQGPNRDKD